MARQAYARFLTQGQARPPTQRDNVTRRPRFPTSPSHLSATRQKANKLTGLLSAGALANGLRLMAAHAQGQVQPAVTFFCRIPGTDAFIAIASDGHQVIAYACDGATNNLGDNFNSTIDQATNGVLTLQTGDSSDLLAIDATTLPSVLTGSGSIQGVFTENGANYPFTTQAAVRPAGLLIAPSQALTDGSTADGGWITLNDGSVRGSFSTQAPGASQPTNFGQSGTLGQSMQMAPAVMSQVNAAQVPAFSPNLREAAQGSTSMLALPVTLPSAAASTTAAAPRPQASPQPLPPPRPQSHPLPTTPHSGSASVTRPPTQAAQASPRVSSSTAAVSMGVGALHSAYVPKVE
jgi:hypothetical protein